MMNKPTIAVIGGGLRSLAAARCTSRSALLRLADFVEEDRSLLRRFAVKELTAITGQNFGENSIRMAKLAGRKSHYSRRTVYR